MYTWVFSLRGFVVGGLMLLPLWAVAQHQSIRGKITDARGQALPMARISLNEALVATAEADGSFAFSGLSEGEYQWRASYVGYEAQQGTLHVGAHPDTLRIALHELSLQLRDVVVTAKQVQMGSKSLIDQDAIRHIQPKSLGDLLQLVPGHLIKNPNLNALSQAQIREIGTNSNNAMGASLVIDGIPLSNDANMQVLNANRYGTSADGNGYRMGENTTAGRGTDLRAISAGHVATMEVIRGIPSVEYGNLTSGVVLVTTKADYTPWEVKAQADPNAKLAYVGKGFRVARQNTMAFAVDWAQSWADTRLHYKGYDRLTATLAYGLHARYWTLDARATLYTSINQTKHDPQMLDTQAEWKNDHRGLRVGLQGRYKHPNAFFTSIDYKLSAQLSRQHDWMREWVSNPDGVITNTREEGLQMATFKRYGYFTSYTIDSKPITLYAQAVGSKYLPLGRQGHTTLKVGVEYTHDGNVGKGLSYDVAHPPQAMSTHTLRPRAYTDIPALRTLTGFVSQRSSVMLGSHRVQVEGGVRMSQLFFDKSQSGGRSHIFVAEPRLNASFNLLHADNNNVLDDLTLTGGYGLSHKMPTLAYLYPDVAYYDHVALARWNDTDPLALVQTTIIRHTHNVHLRPAKARKWEVGITFRKGQVRGTATYFNELHTHEFGFTTHPVWIDYPYYDLPSGATHTYYDAATGQVGYTIGGRPGVATKHTYTERTSWAMPTNDGRTQKHGIEYTLNLGEYKPLRTSLNITGAWFHIKRQSLSPMYTNVNYNTRIPSAHSAMVMLPSGSGRVSERVNTNFALITHIPALKLLFTSTLQVVWRESHRPIYEDADGRSRYYSKAYPDREYMVVDPVGYYDALGAWHAWTPADADNPTLNPYMARSQHYAIRPEVVKPWAMLSLRVTKELGRTAELAFMANNLTNSRQYRRFANSQNQYQVYPAMYFGLEVKLKF